METEQEIVESLEDQQKDFKASELQDKSDNGSPMQDSTDVVASHTATSLMEQQVKWTKAEEMAEQKKLR